MATSIITRNAEIKRRVFSFNKAVSANAQVSFSLTARELNFTIGEYALFCLVHQQGSTVQPCFISYSLSKNVAESDNDIMVSGYVYNPSNADRTYLLIGMALVRA